MLPDTRTVLLRIPTVLHPNLMGLHRTRIAHPQSHTVHHPFPTPTVHHLCHIPHHRTHIVRHHSRTVHHRSKLSAPQAIRTLSLAQSLSQFHLDHMDHPSSPTYHLPFHPDRMASQPAPMVFPDTIKPLSILSTSPRKYTLVTFSYHKRNQNIM